MIPANKEVNKNYEPNSPEDVLLQQLSKTGINRPATVGYPQFSNVFKAVISDLRNIDNAGLSSFIDNKALQLQNELDKIK